MRHAFIGLLRRSVDRKLRIGLLGFREWHFGVGAVNRGCGGHQQVIHFKPAGRFHDVEGSDYIRVKIGAGVLKTVAHTGLCGEMDNDVRLKIVSKLVEFILIFQHPFCRRKGGVLLQHPMASPFQGDVVVVGHPVIAMHSQPLCQ